MTGYGSCCKPREELAVAERERPLKKLIDRLHISPHLFLSRENDDDVRDIGKHDFRSVLLHPMLSNANRRQWLGVVFDWPRAYSNSFENTSRVYNACALQYVELSLKGAIFDSRLRPIYIATASSF